MLNNRRMEDRFVIYFLIFLSILNFFKQGSIIFLFCGLYFLLKIGMTIRYSKIGCVCFYLSIVIFFVSLVWYTPSEAIKAIIYSLAFLVGYEGYYKSENKKLFSERICFAMFMGAFLYILMILLYNIKQGTFVQYSNYRVAVDIWTHQFMSVTLYGALSGVIIGYSFWGLFFSGKKAIRLISIAGLIVQIYLNYKTATRTPFFMLILVYSLLGLAVLRNNKFKVKKKVALSVIFIAVILGIVIGRDPFGMKEYLINSKLILRFFYDANSDSRFAISMKFIKNMWRYPLGGGKISKVIGDSAHNFILEAMDLYGVVAFVLCVIIAVLIIAHIFCFIFKDTITKEDLLLNGMLIALFVQSMLEPIIYGYPVIFWDMLLIFGIIHAKRRVSDKKSILTKEEN